MTAGGFAANKATAHSLSDGGAFSALLLTADTFPLRAVGIAKTKHFVPVTWQEDAGKITLSPYLILREPGKGEHVEALLFLLVAPH